MIAKAVGTIDSDIIRLDQPRKLLPQVPYILIPETTSSAIQGFCHR